MVIEDKRWSLIGVSTINISNTNVNNINNTIVSVINFSSGNLFSTELIKTDNEIIFSGYFLLEPQFDPVGEIYISDNTFKYILPKSAINRIFSLKNRRGKTLDRLELFFM